jgi:hypothetical protein
MLLEQAILFEIVERRLQRIWVKNSVETAASTELIPKCYGLHAKDKVKKPPRRVSNKRLARCKPVSLFWEELILAE